MPGKRKVLLSVYLSIDGSRIEGMKYFWFTGIVVLTFSHAVAAEESASALPSYNVKKYCTQEYELLGNDNSMLKFCLEQEQDSYDQLKKNWSSLDEKVKDECQQPPGGDLPSYLPSYYKLKVCITLETKAKEELS